MMKIFETHAHYDDEAFREDREALFDEMFANDIDTIITVSYTHLTLPTKRIV